MGTTKIQKNEWLYSLFHSLSTSILPHKFVTKIAIITETILSNKAIFSTEFQDSTEKFLPGYLNIAIQIHFLQSKWQERYLMLILTCEASYEWHVCNYPYIFKETLFDE